MPDELDDLLAEGLASKELKDAVRRTVESLRQHPLVGARYRLSAPQLHNLRSWPVAGFEAIRIYYLLDREAIHVIRVRHGKRDLKRILEREEPFNDPGRDSLELTQFFFRRVRRGKPRPYFAAI